MKTGTKILIVVIIIAIVVWVIHATRPKQQAVTTTPPAPTTTNTVSYTCTEGALKAAFSTNQVSLTFRDGTVAVLPQVVSGSGVRYQNDTYTFITKGNDGFLQKGTTTIYNNCIVSTEQAAGSSNTLFTDGSKTFSFVHPKDLIVTGGDVGYTDQWRNNTQTLGLLLAQTSIDQSTQPKTNFGGAKFTIGTSSDSQAIKDCTTATNGEVAKGQATINGTVFNKFALGDAGAGNFYDTTSYRAIHDSQCYAVEYTIHSTNIGNYSPDQGIKQFDEQSVTKVLDGMAQSFKFLQ